MEDNYIVKVEHATVRFNMASERIDNLKEYFVKLVKREPGQYGDVCHVGWAHFNHPGPEHASHRDEWYMYFL